MSDKDVIDGLVNFEIQSDVTNDDRYQDDGEVGISSSDKFTELLEAVMSIKITVEGFDKRLTKLEFTVESLKKDRNKDRPRQTAMMPNLDAMRHSASPVFGSTKPLPSMRRDDDTESFSNVSVTKTDLSGPITGMDTISYMDRTPNPALFSTSTMTPFKTNSAIANRGYDTKLALWGTCFASLVIACMRKYIQFTGETGHIIDERFLMKTYCKIIPDLYTRVKCAELPAVQSQDALFMSKVFSRKDPSDVPVSTANTWWEMNQHADGAACMSVIESVFMAAKMVPEALMHPISQLVENMNQPVVRNSPKGPSFSIPSSTKISLVPNGPENFCRYLKVASLKTYVKYRLQGDNESTTISKMLQTMRETDLFDNKNLHRGRELPARPRYRGVAHGHPPDVDDERGLGHLHGLPEVVERALLLVHLRSLDPGHVPGQNLDVGRDDGVPRVQVDVRCAGHVHGLGVAHGAPRAEQPGRAHVVERASESVDDRPQVDECVGGAPRPRHGEVVHVVVVGADDPHEDEGGLAVGRVREVAPGRVRERVQLLVYVDELVQLDTADEDRVLARVLPLADVHRHLGEHLQGRDDGVAQGHVYVDDLDRVSVLVQVDGGGSSEARGPVRVRLLRGVGHVVPDQVEEGERHIVHHPAVEAHAMQVHGPDPVADRGYDAVGALGLVPEQGPVRGAVRVPHRVPDPHHAPGRVGDHNHLHDHLGAPDRAGGVVHDHGVAQGHRDGHQHIPHHGQRLDAGPVHVLVDHHNDDGVRVVGRHAVHHREPVVAHVGGHVLVGGRQPGGYLEHVPVDEHVDGHVPVLERAHLHHLVDELDHAEVRGRHHVRAHDGARLGGLVHHPDRDLDHAHDVGHHHRRDVVAPQDQPRVRGHAEHQTYLLDQRRDGVQIDRHPLVRMDVPGSGRGVVAGPAQVRHLDQLHHHEGVQVAVVERRPRREDVHDHAAEPGHLPGYGRDVGADDVRAHVRVEVPEWIPNELDSYTGSRSEADSGADQDVLRVEVRRHEGERDQAQDRERARAAGEGQEDERHRARDQVSDRGHGRAPASVGVRDPVHVVQAEGRPVHRLVHGQHHRGVQKGHEVRLDCRGVRAQVHAAGQVGEQGGGRDLVDDRARGVQPVDQREQHRRQARVRDVLEVPGVDRAHVHDHALDGAQGRQRAQGQPVRDQHPHQEWRLGPLRDDARDHQHPRDLRRGHGLQPERDRVADLAHLHEAEDPAVRSDQQVHVAAPVRERVHAVLRLPDRHRGFVLGVVLDREEGHGDGPALVPDQHEAAEVVPGLGRVDVSRPDGVHGHVRAPLQKHHPAADDVPHLHRAHVRGPDVVDHGLHRGAVVLVAVGLDHDLVLGHAPVAEGELDRVLDVVPVRLGVPVDPPAREDVGVRARVVLPARRQDRRAALAHDAGADRPPAHVRVDDRPDCPIIFANLYWVLVMRARTFAYVTVLMFTPSTELLPVDVVDVAVPDLVAVLDLVAALHSLQVLFLSTSLVTPAHSFLVIFSLQYMIEVLYTVLCLGQWMSVVTHMALILIMCLFN
ncbi:MAG: hypothetical protein Q9187_001198 [Circinaria calcarea]